MLARITSIPFWFLCVWLIAPITVLAVRWVRARATRVPVAAGARIGVRVQAASALW